MRSDMNSAYALIAKYKAGGIQPGSEISSEQQRLVRLLSEDLEVKSDGVTIEQLVPLVAKADSLWNRRTMALIDTVYTLRDAGNFAKAERERSAFIQKCPSVWYCGIVSSL